MPTNWRIYKNDTVAAKLARSDLPGFFGKRVVVGPNEAAIIVRDGKPDGILTESSVQVADVFDQLKSQFGMGADLSIYYVSLAPFDITIFLGEDDTAAASAQIAVNTQVDAQAQSHAAIQPADSAERSDWALRTAVEKAARHIGWLQEEEVKGQEQHGQASASVASRLNVSKVGIVALSADREIITASCRIRLRADSDQLESLMALLRGNKGLATWDIATLIREELLAKILIPELARHQSSSLRGNGKLLAQVETDARYALAATLGTFGLLLDDLSVNWGLTELERQEIAQRRGQREEQALQFANNRRIAHMMRWQEVEKTRIANLQELKVAEAAGHEEYKTLLLASELKRDLLIKNQKVDAAQVDAQIRGITLEIEKRESQLRLEQRRATEELRLDTEDRQFKQKHAARLAAIDVDDKEMWSMVRMQVEMATQKHDREMSRRRQELDAELRNLQAEIEDRYQQRKLKLDESLARMGMMERLISQGLITGQADASVLNTMLQQSTDQEYVTTSDEKVQARSAAQAAGKSLEIFRAAQADERAHQRDVVGLAADMMEAAKQSPARPNPVDPRCPSCQNAVQPGMKFCPCCGKLLSNTTP